MSPLTSKFKIITSFLYQKILPNRYLQIIFVIGLIFLQQRFWLYSGIYQDLKNKIGGHGDAYYNLSLYLQNNLNLRMGHIY